MLINVILIASVFMFGFTVRMFESIRFKITLIGSDLKNGLVVQSDIITPVFPYHFLLSR